MTREEKGTLIEELTEQLRNTSHFYIADTGGLSVKQINEFREMCFKRGIEYRVVKKYPHFQSARAFGYRLCSF